MDDYAGRVLADRYRLPLLPSDADDGAGDVDSGDVHAGTGLVETRAFDTYSGQEVMVRQLPLPETVEAEVVEADDPYHRPYGRTAQRTARRADVRATADPAVRRAVEAVQAVAQIPDHPRLDQVFDVFTEAGSLWIVTELIAARPLAALVRDKPLSAYRAAEIASDVLTALRALHAHGWTHRNITVRTVLVCDDGRVVLTGLAAGAAEDALCGYAPVPLPDDMDQLPHGDMEDDGQGGPYEDEAGELDEDEDEDEAEYGDGEGYQDGAGEAYGPALDPAYGDPYVADHGDDTYDVVHHTTPAPLPPGPPALPSGYEPQWVAQVADRIADDDDDDAHEPGRDAAHDADRADRGDRHRDGGGPPRALLAGTWRDGPVPAGGGSSPYGDVAPHGGPRAALHADAQRRTHQQESRPRRAGLAASAPGDREPAHATTPASGPAVHRGPTTPLAAERARQARIAVVGPVTERWAPEQAGPVHGTWQLAPPIGPATDLWALGALLFRVLQGHAPYPEDSAAELVQMVCAEPPAYAEDCGALRPVVESLLRQDPTERPEFEELRGWLRSLIRSAPEPDAGTAVVPMPSADAARLPIVRRRGDLVRRRRTSAPAAAAPARHRHKKTKERRPRGGPRALGRTLLLLIFLALAAAVAYAVLFMPKAESQDRSESPTGTARPTPTGPHQQPSAGSPADPGPTPRQSPSPGSQAPSTNAVTPTAPALADGYVVRDDPEGFRIGVDRTWRRSPINDIGQVRYSDGDYTLIVVPGRDTVRAAGADPLEYQRNKERELQPWRDSSWASATGLRRVDIGRQAMAEGQFTWQDGNGRQVYVRNLAIVIDDRYHVVQAIGPESGRDKVKEIYEQATKAYRATR
ncbi:protein kinase [Streptomyces sp. TRM49041]|uniref:protein kinase n=1 Tax=Streptomyces sp. TRM49041 TaxID=2603216 RepID=UPI0011EC09E6|nr:protein kinase [Streptomyces sp. TRM49041]